MVYRRSYRGSSFRGRGRFRKAGYYGRYKPRMRGGHVIVERKFLDTGSNNASVDVTPESQAANLLTIVQEVGPSGRNGRKIVLTAIAMRIVFHWFSEFDGDTATSVTNTDNNQVRMLVVIDKQANGDIADFTAICDTTVITESLFAYNNLANKGRFITLVDKTFVFNKRVEKLSSTDLAVTRRTFNYYKKCRIPILYSAATGAVSERCCNNIVVYFMALKHDTSSPNVNYVTLDMNNRIRFMDI